MRETWSRERAAAVLYGSLAILAFAAAILMRSILLGVVAAVLVAAAFAARRGYPIDRYW